MARPLAAVAALCLVTCCGPPVVAGAAGERSSHADAPPTALVAEVRRGFTVNGKPIPPEIFRDFGDGDLANSGNIWVTVNVLAATGSNLYFDDIKQDGGWIAQKKVGQNGSGGEETAYKFVGAAANGLVVVIATYNGGVARTGRPGPVVVDIPKDVQNWEGLFHGGGMLPIPGYRRRMKELSDRTIDVHEASRFFEMLGESERPLIYAGGGVVNAGASGALDEFASAFNIPAVTTLMGIGSVDTTSPACLRMLGMHGAAFANYAVDDCDFLIAIGSRFDDRVAGVPAKFAKDAKRIAHFDVDRAEVNKVKRVQWSHIGLLPEALQTLTAHGRREKFKRDYSAWHAHVAEFKRVYAMNYDRDSKLIQPYYVIEEINRHTRGEAIITTGVGQHQMWAAQYCDFRHPRLWLTSGSMGTMGFGLPAAMARRLPTRAVW